MATTDFTTGTTIASTWLNDVDNFVYSTGVTKTGTQTLTNKTVNLTSNTLTGTMAQFDTACSNGNFAYLTTGTFTPTVTFSTPGDLAVTYTEQTGQYTKIGDMVYLSIRIWTNTFTYTTSSGTFRVAGIPFTAAGNNVYYYFNLVTDGSGYTWPATTTQVKARMGVGDTFLILKGLGPAPGTDSFTITEVPTGAQLVLDIDGWIKV